jgi:hypothetical protein
MSYPRIVRSPPPANTIDRYEESARVYRNYRRRQFLAHLAVTGAVALVASILAWAVAP